MLNAYVESMSSKEVAARLESCCEMIKYITQMLDRTAYCKDLSKEDKRAVIEVGYSIFSKQDALSDLARKLKQL